MKVKVIQSCPTLFDPMDFTVHGILQAKILEWLAFPFSKGSSRPRNRTGISCIAGGFFTDKAMREAPTIRCEGIIIFFSSSVSGWDPLGHSVHSTACRRAPGEINGGCKVRIFQDRSPRSLSVVPGQKRKAKLHIIPSFQIADKKLKKKKSKKRNLLANPMDLWIVTCKLAIGYPLIVYLHAV